MSEDTTETQVTETVTSDDTPKPTKPTDTVEFWKQKAREQETRAKANATAAEKLAAFEDRDKTEAQRLTDRADAAEKRATELEARALRLEVAAEQGLTTAQAKRLVGSTREELEADAKELLETFKPSTPDDPASLVVASMDLGTRGTTSKPGKSTAEQFAAAIDGSFTR